ncbi:MAG TPA: NAD(P)-binding domain-containing protein, partial [Gammaproteobacteria bacterium]|nr:NAD(P)-binding domain-containing protein [Gammaproteobacteria bacterium]
MLFRNYPVAIIGAGPVGLAAAAHLLRRGETPLVFEVGPSVGAAVLQWGHVRLFSPWRSLIDREAAVLLETDGWLAPDPEAYPTGRELVEDYLVPLANTPQMKPHLRLQTRVVAVSRQGIDKMKTPGREEAPFVLRLQTASGEEQDVLARAVIDASGTYETPNPLGADGILALGERELRKSIFYGIPDILGIQRERHAGRRVLVVGSGHSAFNALLELAELARERPATRLLWAIRRTDLDRLFGGGERDTLPARGELGRRIQNLVESGQIRLVSGVHIQALQQTSKGIVIAGAEERLGPVDEIIATTGFRPNLSLLRELRLALDASLESPVRLAPLIDPNVHSCGTVPPHGVEELSHPEAHFYIVGMKSYGRAPTFLTLTGYEQVRSIVAALAGDDEAARTVELVLPETGVCSSDAGGSCAVPVAQGVAGQDDLVAASASCCP